MEKGKEKQPKRKREKPVTLAPLTMEEALEGLLKTAPPPKPKRTKKTRKTQKEPPSS